MHGGPVAAEALRPPASLHTVSAAKTKDKTVNTRPRVGFSVADASTRIYLFSYQFLGTVCFQGPYVCK